MQSAIFIAYNLLFTYSYQIDKNKGETLVFIRNKYGLRYFLILN